MWPEFDLLGAPVPRNKGEPGRDAHAFDPEIAKKIRVLLCADMTLGRIAKEVGISTPTMRRVYFQNGGVNRAQAKRVALAEQRAKILLRLDEAADKGNVAAMKAQVQILDGQIAKAEADEEERRRAKAPAKPEGKKARAIQAAHETETELEDWLDAESGAGSRAH